VPKYLFVYKAEGSIDNQYHDDISVVLGVGEGPSAIEAYSDVGGSSEINMGRVRFFLISSDSIEQFLIADEKLRLAMLRQNVIRRGYEEAL